MDTIIRRGCDKEMGNADDNDVVTGKYYYAKNSRNQ